MNKILPLGSVVILSGGTKPLVICGRVQQLKETQTWYEYSGCPFPEGFIASDEMNLFNGKDIKKIIQIGYQDEEENQYLDQLEKIFNQIGDMNEG